MRLLDAQLAAGVKVNAAEFAREHGVSARTVYRHRARVLVEGQWQERSRRPLRSPRVTPADLEAWICKLRVELAPDNGADFIRDALSESSSRTSPTWPVPARSTINRVLARHDLLVRNPARRPRRSWRRFSYARPCDCYQIDATEVRLAEGSKAVVFDVLDDCTRTLVACHAAPAETATAAIGALGKAIGAHGAPAVVLSDNGAASTSRLTRPGSLSSFTRCLHEQGIQPINSSPYHPQTCGKVERHHQTLKKWLDTRPAAGTIGELQQLLDQYQTYYNQRRHCALPGRATPHQAWAAAPSLGGPGSLPLQVDATVHRCTVATNGAIWIGRSHKTSVGRARAASSVTVIRNGDHATVYADGQPIGHAHLDPAKRYTTLIHTE